MDSVPPAGGGGGGGPGPGYPESTDSSPRSRGGDSWDEPFPSSAAAAAAGGGGRLRLMCSFGGRIVPRPTDKSLCYLGGETRIVAVDRNATLADVHARLSRSLLSGQPFTLKYQLPNEDLDSLISVSTDEDLDNLVDEYDRVAAASSGGGSGSSRTSRIRLFLFPAKPESSSSLGSLLDDTSKSETWFVDALNSAISGSFDGIPRGISTDSASVNCLLGLEDDSSQHSRTGVPSSGPAEDQRANQQKLAAAAAAAVGRHPHDVQSVPDSPMLDKNSSFGSTSSAPSLSNLPPIRVRPEERVAPPVSVEDHFAQMGISEQQGQPPPLADMSSSMAFTSAMDAPMSSSLGAMGPLLRKLDSLLPPDYRLPKLLKDRIELLKVDLEEISDALVEQSMVDSPNEMAKYWMNEVRELFYDIENFIDNMMSTHADAKMRSVQSYKVGRVKIAWLPKRLKPCTRAAKITELRALVHESIERHDRYLDGSISSSRSVFTGHARAPVLYAEAANNLVGVHDSKMKLIKWVTDNEEQQLKVVAIVGPAGVGKTTLAKQVYYELGEQFECRAFVRASRKPDMRRLLGGILSQVQGYRRPFDSCTVQSLIDNLTEHLQDKRYVIIIDDLWEKTAWDIVTSAFPEGNNRSRIITTAEIEGVALECCDYQSNNIFKMKPLSREDSGELLFSLVFGPERLCPEQLNGVLDIIITKCAGLPLAIICVAGLLTSQPGNTELWQHVQECLCSNLSTNYTLEETLQEVLKLSYNSLPHYLKTCLMYICMYPEGYTMWKVDLLKQWIAEGFIGATEGTEIGEIADSYFGELVNRGMIQPVDINYNAEVLSCTLCHVVLDLITHESNENNFITTVDYSQTITGLYSKAHRLSLHFSNTRYATKPTGPTLSKVRSIGFFGILECAPSVVEFRLLRVLILEFWGDHRGSMSFNLTRICRLVQLRYLKISCDASVEVELPTQVRMLRYLETLIIDAVVSKVPLDIIRLPGLWHLSLGNKIGLPHEIGRIRSLRTLHYFDILSNSEDNVLSLGNLMNLQDLHLTYYKESDEHPTEESDEHLKRNLRALASSLAKLVNLKVVTLAPGASGRTIYLDVRSSMSSPTIFLQRLEFLPPICIFSRLPEWIGQLQKLSTLKVVISELLMKDMDMLIGLPALTILSLYVQQPTSESIIFKQGAFLGLKYFKYTCGVLHLTFQEEAFPNLQRLELSFNAHRGVQYDHLLSGIDYLLSLKEIVGTIGAAAGAEEPDRRAAESAFKDAIRKHPRFHSYANVKRVDRVCEEYQLRTQEKDSSSEKHESLHKQHRRKEADSSDDQFRILLKETEEDTKQHSDQISHFPATRSIISFDQMKTEIKEGRTPAAGSSSSSPRRPRAGREESSVKLFVGQVPKPMTEAELATMFRDVAIVDEVTVIRDKVTKVSRGCCFLICPSREEADKAVNAYHNKRMLPGAPSPLQVKYADGELERLEHKLFIGMLPKNVTDAEMTDLFSQYGNIKDLQILRGSQQTSNAGCAFLKYETKEQAVAAIEALNGKHKIEGSSVPLVVKWADTEKERQARKVQKAQFQPSNLCANAMQQSSLFGALQMGYVPQYNGFGYQFSETNPCSKTCSPTRVPSVASMDKLVRRWSSVSDMSIDLSQNDNGGFNDKSENGTPSGTPTSANQEANSSKVRADKDASGAKHPVTSQPWSCQKDGDTPKDSTTTNACSTSSFNTTPPSSLPTVVPEPPKKQTGSSLEDDMAITSSTESESSFDKEQGFPGQGNTSISEHVASNVSTRTRLKISPRTAEEALPKSRDTLTSPSSEEHARMIDKEIASVAREVPVTSEQVGQKGNRGSRLRSKEMHAEAVPVGKNDRSSRTVGKMSSSADPKSRATSNSCTNFRGSSGRDGTASTEIEGHDSMRRKSLPRKVDDARKKVAVGSEILPPSDYSGRQGTSLSRQSSNAEQELSLLGAQVKSVNDGNAVPLEQTRMTRPAKGNQDRHDELQMKANELEKLFAAHKLTTTRRGKSTEAQVDDTPRISEAKPTQVLPEKIYTKQIVTDSMTNNFDANELLKMVDNEGYNNSTPDKLGMLSLEESRGKFYDQYMQKRDAKLKEDWKLQKEEKEAILKAMHESLERSKAEMRAKFSQSADLPNSTYVSRSAQKIPPLQSVIRSKDQGVDSLLVEDEMNSDYLSGDGSSRSADSRKHFSNKVAYTQKTSVAPAHKHSSRTVRSSYANRRNPPENPLAQSVPNFSDFRKERKENTKPSTVHSRTTARAQPKKNSRSKSIIEESKIIINDDQSRGSQSMRKTLNSSELRDTSSVNKDVYNWAPSRTASSTHKSGAPKSLLRKANGAHPIVGITGFRAPMFANVADDDDDFPDQQDDSPDDAKDEEYESIEESLRESDFPADSESETPKLSHDFGNSDDPGSENGDVSFPREAANTKFNAFAENMHDLPGELPAPWSSRLPNLLPYANDTSDGDAFADSPTGSPSPWNSHSLDQITDADVSRMRKKWGSAQMPFSGANASQQPRKDVTKGFKKLLKFGRKNRGADGLVNDWVSASTASECDDDMEDGRDLAIGSSDDFRKSRMGYLSSYDGFVENEVFTEQEPSLRSSIPTPPANFRLREDQLTGSSSIKAPRFFSLSTFRSKGGDARLR